MSPTTKPEIKNDPMYRLLQEGKIDEFNLRKSNGEEFDLTHCHLRAFDLRGLDAAGIDFSHSYFRQADIRGIDFSNSNLNGASLNGAQIAGCWFPKSLSPTEISLSVNHGTRIRHDC